MKICIHFGHVPYRALVLDLGHNFINPKRFRKISSEVLKVDSSAIVQLYIVQLDTIRELLKHIP